MSKLFVWDFHGVLEKGNERSAIERSNLVLADCGYTERFAPEHAVQLYGKRWHEYFRHLLPGESQERCLELQKKCFDLDTAPHGWAIVEKHIRPNDHVVDVLDRINSAGHEQIILSNMQPYIIGEFVKSVGLTSHFPTEKLFAAGTHIPGQGTTKIVMLTDYLKNSQPLSVVVIGDSIGDIELGKTVGATTYLYRHPYFPQITTAADYHISDLREILKEI